MASGNDWQSPTPFSKAVPSGSYLYVLAWNVGSAGSANPQAWLGQFDGPFNMPGGGPLYSDLNSWQYIKTVTGNPSSSGIPSTILLTSLIQNNTWQTANPINTGNDLATDNMSLNGAANIWTSNHGGPISGISITDAYWIWWDHFQNSGSQDGYALFRSDYAVVPIPASVLLLGSGILGLGLLGWRQKVVNPNPHFP